ncbi:NTP transferase domain-containing protein [Flagellimonas zhangzhouensis]|uniref:Probable molybdenum cofactor guanylyltransferase n=1 Tax=Flagellimonas zhangzhouensis TaxID=1073328 RepID=A0A1H2SL38_9FLAO|nr:NTP transferase domain-containing protein [Allomuricauda zhangzhouensis]SDQ75622.1 molybdenum cofactor guanylyltransferase [Allomuricauda zhangzhouensis]SDW31769.1 molybdopterin-guanine dinucleotide biosynthesis protein A [Allomuricauda zhangzhouensis]
MKPSELYGLVLAGGSSSRMGLDKGLLEYYQIPHREYLHQLLGGICSKVFLSLRDGQQSDSSAGIEYILDKNKHQGPFNGILSAHEAHPNVAWLVLACDLPFIIEATLKELIQNRNPDKDATAFRSKIGEPEPLACIWEPHGLEKATSFLAETNSRSPKRFLTNADVELIQPANDKVLLNVNTLDEFNAIQNGKDN